VTNGLNHFIRDPESLQGSADEGAGGDLVLQAGVILGAGLGHDAFTVLVDGGGQFLDPVDFRTALHQEFDPANVVNPILRLDAIPEAFPGRSELSRGIRGISDNGKPRWFLRKIFHHFWTSNVFLITALFRRCRVRNFGPS
jgi:hypothetical protein